MTETPDNLALFEDCLRNHEPLVDPFYCNESLIISQTCEAPPTPLMKVNREILDRITAADVALQDGCEATYSAQIGKIAALLREKNVNFTELTSFFPTLDVSYSAYRKLAEDQKLGFLSDAVRLYIEKRHRMYSQHGYTATTLQVRKDFEKHKTGGSAANRKIASLLADMGYRHHDSDNGRFSDCHGVFVFGDSRDADRALQDLREDLALEFRWAHDHQGKNADLLVADYRGRVFICEFKHMKEFGGGQDKQVAELISLLSYGEKIRRVGYVAFLDGIYFNTLARPSARKTQEQVRQIRAYLRRNRQNFFVNTYGFCTLLMRPA